jgi:hypothetical protein
MDGLALPSDNVNLFSIRLKKVKIITEMNRAQYKHSGDIGITQLSKALHKRMYLLYHIAHCTVHYSATYKHRYIMTIYTQPALSFSNGRIDHVDHFGHSGHSGHIGHVD